MFPYGQVLESGWVRVLKCPSLPLWWRGMWPPPYRTGDIRLIQGNKQTNKKIKIKRERERKEKIKLKLILFLFRGWSSWVTRNGTYDSWALNEAVISQVEERGVAFIGMWKKQGMKRGEETRRKCTRVVRLHCGGRTASLACPGHWGRRRLPNKGGTWDIVLNRELSQQQHSF